MTDEEQVFKSLKDLFTEAETKMRRERRELHEKALVFFRNEAVKHMADKEPGGLHMFLIATVDKEVVPPDAVVLDPLGLNEEPHVHCHFGYFYRFETTEEAVTMLSDIRSAVTSHHASEGHQHGYFMVLDQKTYLLYIGQKLSIHTIVSPLESLTFTAEIDKDEPEEFFAKCEATDDIKKLSAALMFFTEAGAEFRERMPETYDLILKRILEANNEGDGD